MTCPAGGVGHRRHVIVIARDHPGLYEYVRSRFATERQVEVVLDRRSGRDRRQAGRATTGDRRVAERRTRPDVDAALRLESMQFITISTGTIRIVPGAAGG
jgi:hypothetical protein